MESIILLLSVDRMYTFFHKLSKGYMSLYTMINVIKPFIDEDNTNPSNHIVMLQYYICVAGQSFMLKIHLILLCQDNSHLSHCLRIQHLHLLFPCLAHTSFIASRQEQYYRHSLLCFTFGEGGTIYSGRNESCGSMCNCVSLQDNVMDSISRQDDILGYVLLLVSRIQYWWLLIMWTCPP